MNTDKPTEFAAGNVRVQLIVNPVKRQWRWLAKEDGDEKKDSLSPRWFPNQAEASRDARERWGLSVGGDPDDAA